MKIFFISLLLLPLLCCGKNTSTTAIPDLAYLTTISETTQAVDHSKYITAEKCLKKRNRRLQRV